MHYTSCYQQPLPSVSKCGWCQAEGPISATSLRRRTSRSREKTDTENGDMCRYRQQRGAELLLEQCFEQIVNIEQPQVLQPLWPSLA